jgi:hypothetical protein
MILIPLTFWLKLPLWSIRTRKIPFWVMNVMIKVYQRFVSIQLFCQFQSNFSHRKINPKIHFDVKGGPKYPIWELSIIKALAFAGRYIWLTFSDLDTERISKWKPISFWLSFWEIQPTRAIKFLLPRTWYPVL